MTDNVIFNMLLLFFVIAPIFDGIVTVLLWKAYRKSKGNRAILERLIGSSAIFTSTLLISILATSRMVGSHLPDDIAVAALIASLILVSVPSLNWLYMYLTGKF